jgi:hypothetical protein
MTCCLSVRILDKQHREIFSFYADRLLFEHQTGLTLTVPESDEFQLASCEPEHAEKK